MPNYGRKHLFNVSDNTTIHTPAGENSNHVTFDSPVAASPDTAVNPAAQQSNKMSFLWVRRRRLKSCASRGTDAATVTSSSMTEMNKKSSSLNALSDLRHFIELKIPDPHLSITPSIEQAPVSPSTSDTSTPFSWPPSVPAKEPRECLAEESTMAMIQLSSGDNRWKDSRCANAATVISSPSISTELMRHHYHSLGSDLSLPVLGLPKGTDTSRSLSDLDRYQRITDSEEKLTGETPISTTTSLLPGQYGRPRPGILESASIPITTIIGCDHSLLNQVDGHIEDGSAVQPTLTHRHAHDQSCRAASFTPKRDATASPYSIIQRDLQSSESSPTTPEIATTSSQDAIRRKSYLQQCFPKTPRICGRCGTEKTSTGSEQKWLIRPELPTARQHQSSVNDDKHYFAEQAAARTMLRSQALAIGNASNQKPTQSRTSGPMQAPYRYIRPGAGSLGRNVQPRKPPTAASADTGAPSNVSGPMQTKKTEATTIPYVILIILVNTMLAIGFAWWNSVQPAFDTQSELRRRRRESASTIGDFGVLLSAGLFCIVGTVVVWYSSGLLKWLVV